MSDKYLVTKNSMTFGLVLENAAVITHPISRCTVVGDNTRFAPKIPDYSFLTAKCLFTPAHPL
jgi:hypothetical protein